MKKIIIILIAGLGIFFALQKYQIRTQDADHESREYDLKILTIGDARVRVEIADTMPKQILGLSDRASLCEACGMLFVFQKPAVQTFVMRGMKFPLDMVFISNYRVTEIWKDIPSPKPGEVPQYIQSLGPADEVLEVNAGFADKNNLKIGGASSVIDCGKKFC